MSRIAQSLWHTPIARSLTRTVFGPGEGMGMRLRKIVGVLVGDMRHACIISVGIVGCDVVVLALRIEFLRKM